MISTKQTNKTILNLQHLSKVKQSDDGTRDRKFVQNYKILIISYELQL